jgi:O-antigen/teichoic acid export membrane protein
MAGKIDDPNPLKAASPNLLDVTAEAMPFALAGVFYLVYHQIGVVLLGWMQGDEPAGIYNVALTVIAALALLPDAVFQKYLMPKTQHWAEHDRARFLRVYRFGNGVMLASGLGLMLALGLASPTLIPWVFGDAYRESGRVLLVLALAVPFRFLSVSVGCALVTGGHMARKNVYHGIAATANVLLNVMLIPGYGVYGVAGSAVLTEALLLGMFLWGVRSHVLGSDTLQGWNVRLGSLHES